MTNTTAVVIRTCTSCGSTVEAPDQASAEYYVANYDLACCDGITPEVVPV